MRCRPGEELLGRRWRSVGGDLGGDGSEEVSRFLILVLFPGIVEPGREVACPGTGRTNY